MQAEFKHGILTLTLPKVAEARHKVVKVSLNTTTDTPEVASPTAEANHAESTQAAEPAI